MGTKHIHGKRQRQKRTDKTEGIRLESQGQKRGNGNRKGEKTGRTLKGLLVEGKGGCNGVEQQVERINPSAAPPTHTTHTQTHSGPGKNAAVPN